jgi:hypothetical protein
MSPATGMKRTFLALALVVAAGCGYHVGGHPDLLPKTIKTIAIPAFGNVTSRPRLPVLLTAEVTREFIARTRYQIVSDPNQADAILAGAVVTVNGYPIIIDDKSGRATGVQVIVNVQLTLTERATGKVLFSRPGWEFRDRYEIATDPQAYFDENDTAMVRLSKDVARSLVTAVLQSF